MVHNSVTAALATPHAELSTRQSAKAPGSGRRSMGWPAVLVSFLALMVGPAALLTTSFGVLAAGLEADTGWNHSSVAYASTLMSLVIMVTSPIQGYLTDRLGGRRVVLASLPLFGLALICLRFATGSLETFYIGCMVASVAGVGLWPGPFMKVVSGWFDRHVGLAFGILTTGLSVSAALIPLLFGWTFRVVGWSNTYALAGVVVIALVWPAAFLFLREARTTPVTSVRVAQTRGAGFSQLSRSRVFWLGLVLFFALGAINAAILVHGIAILKGGGLGLPTALRVQASVGLGAVVGRLATGWLIDRAQVRTVGAAMFAVAAVYFLILSSAPTPMLAVVAAVCGGLVVGAEFNVLGVLIRRHIGTAAFGRAYGLSFAGFHLGGAVGSGGLAFLLARSGSFGPGLTVLLVACVGCALLFVAIGRDPARAPEALA